MQTSALTLTLLLVCGVTSSSLARVSHPSRNHPIKKTHQKTLALAAASPAIQSQAEEDRRYQEVKAQAESNPAVQALKLKADAASQSETRQASILYTQALFQKVRLIDDRLTERANLVEAAVLKRFAD